MDATERAKAGFVGAGVLTVAHEALRRVWRAAPRMDVLGGRALAHLTRRAAHLPDRRLYWLTMAGDLLSNGAHYAVAVAGRRPWLRALLAGGAAGISALTVPQRIGLGRAPHAERRANRWATVGLYTLGALASAVEVAVARRRD